MDGFAIDPELQEALNGIRESVRNLFEQLRLKHHDGDVSGKDRLERVPALAKRNFRNLSGPNPLVAAKEAWRLIDFLEGTGGEGRLTVHARDGLRAIELDRQLATFRSSARWRDAALALRQALHPDAAEGAGEGGSFTHEKPADRERRAPSEAAAAPARKWRRRFAIGAPIGIAASVAIAFLALNRQAGQPADSPSACLALEHASADALAAHWQFGEALVPRPALRPDASQHVYRIDDPADGGPVRSIWTTSTFSYAERTAELGPGGGRSDFRLRVGGWGDTYLSLLLVPVPTNRLVQKAVIQLTVLGDDGSSRPTPMTLRAISDNWSVGSGSNERLWWRDCPHSGAIRRHLPPPGPRDSVYEIEITNLYNLWALGQQAPYGIILEPEQIGSWGPGRPHYSNFNTFYSTRARDPANRPRLILTY